MAIDNYMQIKRLALIAMFSDDYLMEKLVLKGGNALDLVYHIAARSSIDLDFSISDDFSRIEREKIRFIIERSIRTTFNEAHYEVFDVTFVERPRKKRAGHPDFWGGYRIEFKVIDKDVYERFKHNKDSLRRHASIISDTHKRRIRIEISKFEFCDVKQEKEIDGYTIYAYTLEMIVFEKLRALCQQVPEYARSMGKTTTPRARDFFDIYTVCQHKVIDFDSDENKRLINAIFEIKKVPLELLGGIRDHREFHRQDFPSVLQTAGGTVEEFDFYFDYVIKIGSRILHSLGII